MVAKEERVKAVGVRQATSLEQSFAWGSLAVSGHGLESEADPVLELIDPGVSPALLTHCFSFW
jgi:hypothetical protein